jgi:hypothetical protein
MPIGMTGLLHWDFVEPISFWLNLFLRQATVLFKVNSMWKAKSCQVFFFARISGHKRRILG